MTTEQHATDRELLVALRAEGLSMDEINRLLGKSSIEIEYEHLGTGTDRSGNFTLLDWIFSH